MGLMSSVAPRSTLSMPSVTMMGLNRRKAQSTPFTRPIAAPDRMPTTTPMIADICHDVMASAVIMPEKAILEPIDRSTCPAMTRRASVVATTPIAA